MYFCRLLEHGSKTRIGVYGSKVILENNYEFHDQDYNFLVESIADPFHRFRAHELIEISKMANDGTFNIFKIFPHRSEVVKLVGCKYYTTMIEILGNYYFVVDLDGSEVLMCCDRNSNILSRINISKLRNALTSYREMVFARDRNSVVYCLDRNLQIVWQTKPEKRLFFTGQLYEKPLTFEDVVIVNLGEDNTDARGNFQINAYQYETGDLVWQQIVETSPNMSSLIGDKLYVCVKNRFRRIDARTGAVEVDEEFDYKSFDGKIGEIGGVYPIKDGLLCTNKNNSYVELRTFDARTILQTIRLPETYCYSGEESPVEFEERLYLNLTHVMPIPFNFMKSGIAVLTPNADAPANVEATLEARPPYTIEAAKDDAGNNAHLVRVGGNDEKKILRYSQVILKEIAVKTGVAWGWEFEEHDKKHAGKLYLEIDTKDLAPGDRTKEEWLEYFKVIKTRVDDELFSSKVIAGNGKHRYRVLLSIA